MYMCIYIYINICQHVSTLSHDIPGKMPDVDGRRPLSHLRVAGRLVSLGPSVGSSGGGRSVAMAMAGGGAKMSKNRREKIDKLGLQRKKLEEDLGFNIPQLEIWRGDFEMEEHGLPTKMRQP